MNESVLSALSGRVAVLPAPTNVPTSASTSSNADGSRPLVCSSRCRTVIFLNRESDGAPPAGVFRPRIDWAVSLSFSLSLWMSCQIASPVITLLQLASRKQSVGDATGHDGSAIVYARA